MQNAGIINLPCVFEITVILHRDNMWEFWLRTRIPNQVAGMPRLEEDRLAYTSQTTYVDTLAL